MNRAAPTFQVCLQSVENGHRMRGIIADPKLVNLLDRQRIEIVPALASRPDDDDQVGLFQHLQMLHDGTAIHV